LSFWERLRGWIETLPPDQAGAERLDINRRALAVVRRLKRYGLFSRPVQGVVLHIEAAERLADLLDRANDGD
jgi:hypothetical protein